MRMPEKRITMIFDYIMEHLKENSTRIVVVTHDIWRSATHRQWRWLILEKAGILAVKAEKPSLVSSNKEMASFISGSIGSSEFAAPLPMLLRW